MARHPTPIADELLSIGASLVARARADQPLAGVELLRNAERLGALAHAAAPFERFYAELIAEAAEHELAQFDRDWQGRRC